MKLTNVTATLKANAVKVLAATALAGALLTAAAPAAQAQHFGVGVRIGGPAYYGPRYYAPPPRPYYGYGYRPGFYAPYGYGYGWHYHHIDRWGHRW